MGYTITQDDVQAVLNARDAVLRHIRESVAAFPEVSSECDTIDAYRSYGPERHAKRCILFGITSPQTQFDKNVRAAVRLHDHLYEAFPESASVQYVLEGWGDDAYMGAQRQAEFIYHSLQVIRSIRGADCNWDALWALRDSRAILGMASKTIALASALYNPDARVYTLDRWMLRGLLEIAGFYHDAGSEITISRKRYATLQAFLLELADEAGARPFVAQWAQWNAFRNGKHETHLPIFQ